MTNSLNELANLSTRCKISRETYLFIISDGYRWDTFRKVFERKKWFVEGSFIGCRFVEFARKTTIKKDHKRELLLCYNFLLKMFDKADLYDAFCDSLLLGFVEITWTVSVPPLTDLEIEFILNHFPDSPISRTEAHPLYIWIGRYMVNEKKKGLQRHYHLQNNDVLSVKLQNVESLINFLTDCT